MKTSSNSLTIRGANSLLKRALELRSRRQGVSMQELVLAILEKEVAREKQDIEYLDSRVTINV